LDVKYRIRKY